MEMAQRVAEQRLDTIEKNEGHIWEAMRQMRATSTKMSEDLGRVKVDVAKVVTIVGMVQVILTGLLVFFLTKGKEEKHVKVHQTKESYLVVRPGPGLDSSR